MAEFVYQQTGSAPLDRVQSNILTAFRALGTVVDFGRTFDDFAVGTGDTRLDHGLGRAIKGFLVVRQHGSASVFEGTPSTAPAVFLNLRASAAVTVTLVVF